jgi:hypothetical protein
MLDVGKVQTADQIAHSVLHPVTGEPTGAVIHIAGPEHPSRRKYRFELQRKWRARLASKTPGTEPDMDDMTTENIEAIATAVVGWEGIGEDGVPIPFTTEAARKLLLRPELAWLAEQVASVLNDTRNFIKVSSGS